MKVAILVCCSFVCYGQAAHVREFYLAVGLQPDSIVFIVISLDHPPANGRIDKMPWGYRIAYDKEFYSYYGAYSPQVEHLTWYLLAREKLGILGNANRVYKPLTKRERWRLLRR